MDRKDVEAFSVCSSTTTAQRILRAIVIGGGLLALSYVVSCILLMYFTDIGFVHFTTQFLRYVLPSLTPIVGAIALYATFSSLDQKRESDERSQYYSQLHWAINKIEESEGELQAVMVKILNATLRSRKIAEEERPIAEEIVEYIRFVEYRSKAKELDNQPAPAKLLYTFTTRWKEKK